MIAGEEVVHETPPQGSVTDRQIKHVIRFPRRTLIRFCGSLQHHDAARVSQRLSLCSSTIYGIVNCRSVSAFQS